MSILLVFRVKCTFIGSLIGRESAFIGPCRGWAWAWPARTDGEEREEEQGACLEVGGGRRQSGGGNGGKTGAISGCVSCGLPTCSVGGHRACLAGCCGAQCGGGPGHFPLPRPLSVPAPIAPSLCACSKSKLAGCFLRGQGCEGTLVSRGRLRILWMRLEVRRRRGVRARGTLIFCSYRGVGELWERREEQH